MTNNIKKLSIAYMRYGLMTTVALALVGLMVMQIWFLDLLTPIIVSVVFSLVTCVAISQIWKRIAQSSPDSLPTFFTAVSGFRLLLALAVMFVYYLVDNQDSMLQFFLVFIAFYFAMLIHHSIFFARINNR
ncbi:hypothetical protein [Xylanibacter ruminicola]|uniref:ATP synthase protein I n=1 Tax=Xylanibacter ruminicola TaxID=839 RepID=A0A1M6YCG0_XYLRU|nr:hypothetical protein [Xylanibacter ruminicola]SHL15803.1 hypothetical protein SAMN05216463_1268 [Xylanibacter ruminicola]